MIAKLMSRKKSYERIMKIEESGGGRHSSLLHPELSSKKNQDVLMTANRGGGVSRVQSVRGESEQATSRDEHFGSE